MTLVSQITDPLHHRITALAQKLLDCLLPQPGRLTPQALLRQTAADSPCARAIADTDLTPDAGERLHPRAQDAPLLHPERSNLQNAVQHALTGNDHEADQALTAAVRKPARFHQLQPRIPQCWYTADEWSAKTLHDHLKPNLNPKPPG